MKWTKEKLIQSFKDLELKLGARPSAEQFYLDVDTPSNMPIRQRFGNWTDFVKAMGLEPLKPSISPQARRACIESRTGARSGAWKGGKHMAHNGYINIFKPEHKNSSSNGYIQEHRLIMSEYLDRPLKKGENVHHVNGVRDDNRIENLELWTTQQPSGQRVEDKISWAIKFLKEYGYETSRI